MQISGDKRAGLADAVFSGFFLLFPLISIAGGLGMTLLVSAAGAAGAPWRTVTGGARAAWPFVAALAIACGYVALSALWAPAFTTQGPRLLGILATGLLFCAGVWSCERARMRTVALIGIGALATLGLIEALFDLALTRMFPPTADPIALLRNPGQGVTLLVLTYWAGLGGWLGGGRVHGAIALLLLPVVGWLSLQFVMAANAAAFLAALCAFALGCVAPRVIIPALGALLAGWILAAPWALPWLLDRLAFLVERSPDSWAIRAVIWRFVSARIAEAPLIGHGLDASRGYADEITTTRGIEHGLVPLHPHNGPLQIWLETGLIGAALASACVIIGTAMAARALKGSRLARASACATLAAGAVIANVSFGVWQEWWIAALFTAAALAGAARATS